VVSKINCDQVNGLWEAKKLFKKHLIGFFAQTNLTINGFSLVVLSRRAVAEGTVWVIGFY